MRCLFVCLFTSLLIDCLFECLIRYVVCVVCLWCVFARLGVFVCWRVVCVFGCERACLYYCFVFVVPVSISRA